MWQGNIDYWKFPKWVGRSRTSCDRRGQKDNTRDTWTRNYGYDHQSRTEHQKDY
jgi:hypothetical protein